MSMVLPSSDGHPGGPHHLIGADQALPVPWMEALGGDRIELREPLTKHGAARFPVKFYRLPLDLLGNFWNRREPVLKRPDVKPGAADENGQAPRIYRGDDLVQRERAPPGNRAALGGIQEAVKPVLHPPFGDLVRTRGQYPEIAITLQAVGIDDGAAQGVGQLEREYGFSACRWTSDDEYRRRVQPASHGPACDGGICRSRTMVHAAGRYLDRRRARPIGSSAPRSNDHRGSRHLGRADLARLR